MALNKDLLQTTLTAIFSDLSPTATPATKAKLIADAIDAYVKSGTVTSNGATAPTAPGVPAAIIMLPGTIS